MNPVGQPDQAKQVLVETHQVTFIIEVGAVVDDPGVQHVQQFALQVGLVEASTKELNILHWFVGYVLPGRVP